MRPNRRLSSRWLSSLETIQELPHDTIEVSAPAEYASGAVSTRSDTIPSALVDIMNRRMSESTVRAGITAVRRPSVSEFRADRPKPRLSVRRASLNPPRKSAVAQSAPVPPKTNRARQIACPELPSYAQPTAASMAKAIQRKRICINNR